ncbi:MAG TPA: hypothetical protein VHK88_17095, partial [Aquihabitans sp.]|nr:hypothetical protein [Aquihabitans sp.]
MIVGMVASGGVVVGVTGLDIRRHANSSLHRNCRRPTPLGDDRAYDHTTGWRWVGIGAVWQWPVTTRCGGHAVPMSG